MKTYIDIYLSSEGASLKKLLAALKKIGLEPISGSHDFVIDWENEKEFLQKMEKVYKALKGKRVTYRLETVTGHIETMVWPPGGSPKE